MENRAFPTAGQSAVHSGEFYDPTVNLSFGLLVLAETPDRCYQ